MPRHEEPPVYDRIAVFRAERGTSRRELATAVGVHPQTIGYIERGEYRPSLSLSLKLAEHFGVPAEVLFSLKPFAPWAPVTPKARRRPHEPPDERHLAQDVRARTVDPHERFVIRDPGG